MFTNTSISITDLNRNYGGMLYNLWCMPVQEFTSKKGGEN